jgi:DNA-binding NarL/FixJ family response regulator
MSFLPLVPKTVESALRLEIGQKPVRLIIADASTMGCELLQTSFRRFPQQFAIAACEVSSDELVRSTARGNADVALINADLQDGRLMGLEALRILHISHPEIRCVIIFDTWRDELILHAFRAGAKGVFCRSECFDRLCTCIQSVHNGQVWANSSQLLLLLEAFTNTTPVRVTDAKDMVLLTKRESQVVLWISEGLPNREISLKLGISEHTVSNYLFRIFNKLGVSNRLELALYAIKQRHDSKSQLHKNSLPIENLLSDHTEPRSASKAERRRVRSVQA